MTFDQIFAPVWKSWQISQKIFLCVSEMIHYVHSSLVYGFHKVILSSIKFNSSFP